MRNRTWIIGLVVAITAVGTTVWSAQAAPPKTGGWSGPPWARTGAGGGPPWMQARGRMGGPPWARGGMGGGPPWMQAARGIVSQRRAARFSRLDRDGDGKISKKEVLAIHAKADANGDGAVTREELSKHILSVGGGPPRPRPGGGRPSAAMLFGNFDSNKDAKLTKDEVPAPVWERLGTADANKDGAVTEAEFEKATSRRGGPPAKAKDAE